MLRNSNNGAASDHDLDETIDVAASVVSMVNVDRYERYDGREVLRWPDEDSLDDVLRARFTVASLLDNASSIFPRSFTAMALDRIGGLKIAWTSSLTNHLLLTEDGSKVWIFSHISFLKWQTSRY